LTENEEDFMRWLLILILLFLNEFVNAEPRYALLIANQNYPKVEQDVNIFGKLETTVNEMQGLAKVLRSYSFNVTEVANADSETMSKAINQFISSLQAGDVGLLYYAGHGVQVDMQNYLIPVDKKFADAIDVKHGAYLAQSAIDKLSRSSARVKLVFLDSCRNHLPVKDKSRGFSERGFAKMDAKGVVISYATGLGEIANDEITYTSQLIKAIQAHANQPIEVVLSEAQELTAQATGDRQTPWYEKGMVGKFCFGTCGKQENTAELERLRRENELLKQQQANVQPSIVTPPVQLGKSFRDKLKDGSLGPEFVQIPGGTFQMGSNDGEDYEKPAHTVSVKSFAMGKYEVTRGEFKKFVEATNYQTDAENEGNGCAVIYGSDWDINDRLNWKNPSFKQDDKHPVVCVSWNDAKNYARWLSEQTGKSYHLPSEAQWEYVAKTVTSKYCWGDNANESCHYGNIADENAKVIRRYFDKTARITARCNDGYVFTSPVGIFLPNKFGLYDITGNVLEWSDDAWHHNYTGAPIDGSSWINGEDNGIRVVRGSSWVFNSKNCTNRSNSNYHADASSYNLGFRIARIVSLDILQKQE